MSAARMLARVFALTAALALVGCDREGGTSAVYPPAEAYDRAPQFVGTWRGQVGELSGELRIGELGPRRYFANFTSDNRRLELALLLDQSLAEAEGGASLPSNRLLFTWQDGEGSRGHGWLKITLAGDRLAGSSGPLESIDGTSWNFERVTQP